MALTTLVLISHAFLRALYFSLIVDLCFGEDIDQF